MKKTGFFFHAVCLGVLVLAGNGCARFHVSELKTLRDLGEDEKEKTRILEQEAANFERVRTAALAGRLQNGLSRSEAIESFGFPAVSFPDEKGERWVYSGKGGWFGAPKIYLHFDDRDGLKNWACVRTGCGREAL